MKQSNEVSNTETNTSEATQTQASMPQHPIGKTPEQLEPTLSQKTGKKWLLPGLISLVVVALGITGYFAYQNYQLKKGLPGLGQITPTPASDIPTPTIDPTHDWETYSNNEYTFKYPKGLKSDTKAAGQGFKSIRVQFMGPKQVASGRTQTSLFDGYSFVVTKISSNTSKTAQQQAQEERANSEENCGFDQSTISPITQIQTAGISASQYSVTECFGDYTSSYLVNNGNLYRITQLYTGEESEKKEYKAITNQIISTFKFIGQAEPAITQITKATLVATNGWKNASMGSLSVRVPTQTTVTKSNCVGEPYTTYEECYLISGHDDSLMSPPHITIKIKTYQGGSRRQEAGLTQNPGTYTYTEKAFGNNKGLEAVFNCEIDGCTALRNIVLVVDNKLIFVTDGFYKQSDGTTSLESPITNTITSTID